MSAPARPLFAIYVVWHPQSAIGKRWAELLHAHYRRDHYKNVAGGTGLSVMYRYQPPPDDDVPIGISFEDAEMSAVVVIRDAHISTSASWRKYVDIIINQADANKFRAMVFQVEPRASNQKLQSIILHDLEAVAPQETAKSQSLLRRLTSQLSYQFCRMLRQYLRRLEGADACNIKDYLEKICVFLSHSKHDANGQKIASLISRGINKNSLSDFFDVRDIPPGLPFCEVLEHHVRFSAVVAIQTDTYSSREWCRREVILAKRYNVPFVVANCLTDVEERGFPYLGNVPVVRVEIGAMNRVDDVIARLLEEVLRSLLWRCRLKLTRIRNEIGPVAFLPRPPELVSLAFLAQQYNGDALTIVYPDPPLGREEADLFEAVVPDFALFSYTEWLAETI